MVGVSLIGKAGPPLLSDSFSKTAGIRNRLEGVSHSVTIIGILALISSPMLCSVESINGKRRQCGRRRHGTRVFGEEASRLMNPNSECREGSADPASVFPFAGARRWRRVLMMMVSGRFRREIKGLLSRTSRCEGSWFVTAVLHA